MYYENASRAQFAEYILEHVKPDLVSIHDYWAIRSGLPANREFTDTYLALGAGDFVRRASLPANLDDAAVRAIRARLASPPPLAKIQDDLARTVAIQFMP
jgi:hypothetical protein